ncbi:MAG: hypothetical protein ACXWR1_07300 [Bdellovibrionota bacterium]
MQPAKRSRPKAAPKKPPRSEAKKASQSAPESPLTEQEMGRNRADVQDEAEDEETAAINRGRFGTA